MAVCDSYIQGEGYERNAFDVDRDVNELHAESNDLLIIRFAQLLVRNWLRKGSVQKDQGDSPASAGMLAEQEVSHVS